MTRFLSAEVGLSSLSLTQDHQSDATHIPVSDVLLSGKEDTALNMPTPVSAPGHSKATPKTTKRQRFSIISHIHAQGAVTTHPLSRDVGAVKKKKSGPRSAEPKISALEKAIQAVYPYTFPTPLSNERMAQG